MQDRRKQIVGWNKKHGKMGIGKLVFIFIFLNNINLIMYQFVRKCTRKGKGVKCASVPILMV